MKKGDTMSKKVYFCGSIRGGRADESTYQKMVSHMEENGHTVLTAHVAFPERSPWEKDIEHRAADVYQRDMAWLRDCDVVIAECSQPSHGVGYELAYGEAHGKESHVFYRKGTHLSAMISGDPFFQLHPYECVEEILDAIDGILSRE